MEAQLDAYTTPQGDLLGTPATAFNQPRFIALNGRIGRLRYIAYGTAMALVSYLIMGLAGAALFGLILGAGASSTAWLIAVPIIGLMLIPLMVFSWGFLVRRLNDLNHSGWLSLLMLVPLANIGLGLYAVFAKGTEGANNYGAPPPPNSRGVIFLSCVMPVLAIAGIIAAIAIPAFMSNGALVNNYEAAAQQTEESFEQNSESASPTAAEEAATEDAETGAEGETSDDAAAEASEEPVTEETEQSSDTEESSEAI